MFPKTRCIFLTAILSFYNLSTTFAASVSVTSPSPFQQSTPTTVSPSATAGPNPFVKSPPQQSAPTNVDTSTSTGPNPFVKSPPQQSVPTNVAPNTATAPTNPFGQPPPQQGVPNVAPSTATIPNNTFGQPSPQQSGPTNVAPSATDSKSERFPQFIIYKGILDRFKQNNGIKKFSTVIALFDKTITQSVHQEPAVLLSDGHSKAILTVDLPAGINFSPNVAVSGGTLVSFKHDKQMKERWIVEVLPDAGSINVSITIIAGAEGFEYPLTVSPPIKTELSLDESGWNKFLAEVASQTVLLHDFNNDGVRDYRDEYIFVANLIAKKMSAVDPSSSSKTLAK